MKNLEKVQTHSPGEKPKYWLQRLKDESWEAELLISAVAIFGTFQLFKVIDWCTNMFIDTLTPDQHLIGYIIVFFGLLAVSMLASMFVIHFFLRAYWVGLVGLNSVYPEYGLEDSAYSKIYTEKLLSILPKLKDSVAKVDQLCSVIFSAAFGILLVYSHMAILASLYLFVYNFLSRYIPSYILLIPLGLLILALVLQLLIGIVANIKKFKENRTIQLWYFKMVKFTSILTFGPLYKNILQITMTFGSNYKKNKSLIGLVLLFLFLGVLVSNHQVNHSNIRYLIRNDAFFDVTKIYSGYYRTENKELDFLLAPEIESDIIRSSPFRVFIPIYDHERKTQELVCGSFESDLNRLDDDYRAGKNAFTLECYQKYHHILLNGKRISLEFVKYNHPITNQLGIVGYIDANDILRGKNTLEVKKVFDGANDLVWSIPFFYAPESR